jgi:hypothetical protein
MEKHAACVDKSMYEPYKILNVFFNQHKSANP